MAALRVGSVCWPLTAATGMQPPFDTQTDMMFVYAQVETDTTLSHLGPPGDQGRSSQRTPGSGLSTERCCLTPPPRPPTLWRQKSKISPPARWTAGVGGAGLACPWLSRTAAPTPPTSLTPVVAFRVTWELGSAPRIQTLTSRLHSPPGQVRGHSLALVDGVTVSPRPLGWTGAADKHSSPVPTGSELGADTEDPHTWEVLDKQPLVT